MPSLFFDVQEVEETKTHTVNESGYLYVGRKYSGKEVIWIKLKECKKKLTKEQGSNEYRKSQSPHSAAAKVRGMDKHIEGMR